jgi:hypothetical protein
MWVNKKARREARNEHRNDNKFLYQLTATYNLSVGSHNLDFLVGASAEEQDWEYTFLDSWDFGSDDIKTFNAATALGNGTIMKWRLHCNHILEELFIISMINICLISR